MTVGLFLFEILCCCSYVILGQATRWPPYYTSTPPETTSDPWYSTKRWPPYYSSTPPETTSDPWYSSTRWPPFYTSTSYDTTTYPWDLTTSISSTPYEDTTTTEQPYSTEKACDCGKNSLECEFDPYGNKICTCSPGYAEIAGICSDCNCGKHSWSCSFNAGQKKVCLCEEGYAQKKRECVATCKFDRDCFNGGICKLNVKGQSFCECKRDFGGDKCEVNNICKRMKPICEEFGAVCQDTDGIPSCVCPPQKVLRAGICEDICSKFRCVYGRCEIFGRTARCRCEEGYTGHRCDIKKPTSDPECDDFLLFLTILPLSSIIIFIVLALVFIILYKLKTKRRTEEKK